MLYLNKKIEINTKNYGKVAVRLDSRCKYGNGYFVIASKKNKRISGYIDLEGNEIIPLQNAILSETIIASNGSDFCFAFKFPDSPILEYYHVRTLDKHKSKLVLRTSRFDEVPLAIRMVDDNRNYWVFETMVEHKQYAIYDYKNIKVATNFFDKLEFLDESPYHMAYFEMDLVNDVEYDDGYTEPVLHTTLCAFLDSKCNLSSEILDVESKVIYDSYMYGPTTLSNRFKKLLDTLKKKYLDAYYEDIYEQNLIINSLYESPNTSKKIEFNKRGKIVEFNPRKKV